MAKAVKEANSGAQAEDEESDAEWYKKEVGEEPDEGNIYFLHKYPKRCVFYIS